MKKNEVKIGECYTAKVSDQLTTVRIDSTCTHGGWNATNTRTGKRVRIKSAQRLRARAAADAEDRPANEPEEAPAETGDPDVCATVGCDRPSALTYLGRARCQQCYEDDVADDGPAPEVNPTVEIVTGQPVPEPGGDGIAETVAAVESGNLADGVTIPTPAKRKRAANSADGDPAKPKRLSAIDAAAQVLAEARKPMRTQELIDEMASRGLWSSPNGKTPAATLYAAILREINTKGAEARFQKADRGQFAAAS